MATSYGYAEVIAISQSGAQAAEEAFTEESACMLQASWFDAAGNSYVPKFLNYRLDDIESLENILAWTSLTPAAVNTVTVSSAQNAMVNASRQSETHQALFQVTDQNGAVFYARVKFDIVRAAGLN
jgi:hypothetical protein